MRVRKLLDWRKLLIYSHRWLGIVVGAVFVVWCVSGIVLMYAGVPHLTAGERLMRLPPLELSTIRVTPGEAAAMLKDAPRRLRISMHGNRPVYRFNTGRVFGRWTLIYADTGEPVAPLDREAAIAWLRGYLPDRPTLRYDAYLERPIPTPGFRRCRPISPCIAWHWTMPRAPSTTSRHDRAKRS